MTNSQPEIPEIQVMPYSMMVGQEDLKLALELAFIAPKIGGVLLSGDRVAARVNLRSFVHLGRWSIRSNQSLYRLTQLKIGLSVVGICKKS